MSPWLDLNDTDAHERETRLEDLVLLKALVPYVKPHWKKLTMALVLIPLISISQVVQPFIIKNTLDGPVMQGNLQGLALMASVFLGVLAVHYSLRYWQMYLAQVTGQSIVLSLRTALYDHLQRLPNRFYNEQPLGKLVTRISSDIENINEVFASGGIAIFADFAVILGILVAMFLMDVRLATIAVLIVPVVIVTMEFFRRRSREAYNALRVQLAQINTQLNETITGMDVIQLTGRQSENIETFKQANRRFMKTNIRSIMYDSSFTASVELLSLTTLVMVTGFLIWQYAQGSTSWITIGLFVAFIQYIQMLFEPIEELSDKFTIIQSGLASIEKIMELMAVQPEIQNVPNPVVLSRARGEIAFEQVVFGYNPTDPVLKGVSLKVRPGEKIALIGPTGAGKSTVIKLLDRQYDVQEGRILLDGVDIRTYAMSDLRRNIVVIPQEDFLFSRSLTENITLSYKTPVDKDHLSRVIERVHVQDIVSRLPQGVDTMLPERGRMLSNGERQLLIFARALWHDPAIIVMDEATSAIDPKTETMVQDALEATFKGRTAIIIAHRLSTIQQVDTVYVLQHGQIVESGSPDTLYHQKGAYYHYLEQMKI